MIVRIPELGREDIKFFSYYDSLLANGYERVEFGKRGPYIEFSEDHIDFSKFYIPRQEKWRIHSLAAFYIEFRSLCQGYVKLYLQKKEVDYANYIIGKCYISPKDLKCDLFGDCIKKESKPSKLELFF